MAQRSVTRRRGANVLQKYGWKRQHTDHRDRIYWPSKRGPVDHLPERVDFRQTQQMPPVYDQMDLGSCTACGVAFCYMYEEIQHSKSTTEPHAAFQPSRLFIYYNERVEEGTVDEDAGAEIRDGIKTINKIGVCSESSWPYTISKFTQKPPQSCYDEADNCKSVVYSSVLPNVQSMKHALSDGYPVVFGFDVYQSFEHPSVAKSGNMPVPNTQGHQPERLLGGHCVVAIGYDDKKNGGSFIVRNSWGESWGDRGNFYMPYAVVNKNMVSDCWIISQVTTEGGDDHSDDNNNGPNPQPQPEPSPIAVVQALVSNVSDEIRQIQELLAKMS